MTSDDENNDDASSAKPWKHSELKKFVIGSLIYIIVATISFYFVIDQFCGNQTKPILDACYFAIVVMTSSGYTDLTPNRDVAIAFAIIFAILGMGVFGALMSVGADQILGNQQKSFEVLELAKKHQKVQYSSIMIKYSKVLAVWLVVHMVGGIYFLACKGKMHFFRAVYCAFSTITTVISNDKCFSTEGRRIIALILILDGMIVVGAIICVVTELWTQRAKFLPVKKNLKRRPSLEELQEDDFDEDDFIQLKGYTRFRSVEKKLYPKIKESGHQASLNSDDIWDTIIVYVVYLGSSIIIFYVIRDHLSGKKTNRLHDAVYFSFSMMTSVGYGDLSPDDTLAKIFASIFSLSGLCVIGKALSTTLKAIDKKHIDNFRKLLSKIDHGINPKVPTRKESILKKFPIKLAVLVVLMAFGTPIVVFIEDLDFIHGVYCTSITITSSGTEKCFSTKGGRGFALLCMLIGAMYKGWVFFIFTEVYIEEKQRSKLSKREPRPKEEPTASPKEKKDDLTDYPPKTKPTAPKKMLQERLPPRYGATPEDYPYYPPIFKCQPPGYCATPEDCPYCPYYPPIFKRQPPGYGATPEDCPYCPYYPPSQPPGYVATPEDYPYYPPIVDTPEDYPYYPPIVDTPEDYPYYPSIVDTPYSYPPSDSIEPPGVDKPKPYGDDDGDPIILEDSRVEEMVRQQDEKDRKAIEEEFKMLDVGHTGRLTLDEVMNS